MTGMEFQSNVISNFFFERKKKRREITHMFRKIDSLITPCPNNDYKFFGKIWYKSTTQSSMFDEFINMKLIR